jgi:DNA-binding beta-propeller fold protein YncE
MRLQAFFAAALAALAPAIVTAGEAPITFSKLWTHTHATAGQLSEIPAYDARTHTIWVAGVVGVDVLDAATGALIEHIAVPACSSSVAPPCGTVNSVAVQNGLAAFAIESSDRTAPGIVAFYDTRTRAQTGHVAVGALPDMLAFTHDGSRLLVANEATPYVYGSRIGTSVPWVFAAPAADPAGSVSIIDVETRSVIATPGFAGVPAYGSHLRTNTGMDFEPEYIAIAKDGTRAFVTLQEANAVAVLDLASNAFTAVIGLGAKDFGLPGNQIDPQDNSDVEFISPTAKGLYMPDGIAAYKWRGATYLVMANEGDFREDDADRLAASALNAAAPLNRLRVSATESAPGDLYAAGARSFSIRDESGNLVYDSGDILDKEADRRGIYNDGRSRDKGVEPEGVALHDIGGRTYAFVGLERTTKSAVAVFDITDPNDVGFVDMIVGEGDVSPEGIAAFRHRGNDYLVVAHEVSNTTTLYRIDRVRGPANR